MDTGNNFFWKWPHLLFPTTCYKSKTNKTAVFHHLHPHRQTTSQFCSWFILYLYTVNEAEILKGLREADCLYKCRLMTLGFHYPIYSPLPLTVAASKYLIHHKNKSRFISVFVFMWLSDTRLYWINKKLTIEWSKIKGGFHSPWDDDGKYLNLGLTALSSSFLLSDKQ